MGRVKARVRAKLATRLYQQGLITAAMCEEWQAAADQHTHLPREYIKRMQADPPTLFAWAEDAEGILTVCGQWANADGLSLLPTCPECERAWWNELYRQYLTNVAYRKEVMPVPNIKTEVSAKSKANVAYAAALLGETESSVYGEIIDMVADTVTAEKLYQQLSKRRDELGKDNGENSEDS